MKETEAQDVVYARRKRGARSSFSKGYEDGFEREGFGGSSDREGPGPAFDFLSFLSVILRQWRWMAGGALILAVLGCMAGLTLWEKNYTATAQLVRNESPNTVSVLGDRQVSAQTFAGMLRAPELIERASVKMETMTPEDLAANLRIMPERNSEILTIAVSARTAEEAVRGANTYATEAVSYTQEMQGESASEMSRFIHHQLAQINQEIQVLNRQWWNVTRSTALAARSQQPGAVPALAPATPARTIQLAGKLDAARDELFDLLTRYTDAHPLVQAQRARISAIEKQLEAMAPARVAVAAPAPSNEVAQVAKNSAGTNLPADPETDLDIIKTKLTALESARLTLLGRQSTLELFEENSPGNYRLLLPATLGEAIPDDPKLKTAFLTVFGGVAGMVLAALFIAVQEVMDDRLKTADDVNRVTRLPVLARLGNVEQMSAMHRRDWAFRTWTMLQNRIGTSPNQGLVCGITASSAEEERSVWLNLLAQAAGQCGFKVLTISTKKSPENAETGGKLPSDVDAHKALTETLENSESALLAPNALSSPSEISERLSGVDAQPLVHIPLPGWVWNLERRKQWKAALEQWQQIDNVVILVELPPASTPEGVLLAENLPNLIWLTESGKATAAETRSQIETLNNACCNIVGAVLKDDSTGSFKPMFSRWTQTAAA